MLLRTIGIGVETYSFLRGGNRRRPWYNHYALRVVGFSMVGDGVMDGDLILVRQQANAEMGDPVVAILKGDFEEKATLKRFYPKGDIIELRPRNPLMPLIKVKPEELEIRGKYLGLIRNA